MLFTGQAEASIDQKDRLAIPSKYRSLWEAERDGKAWMCVPWPGGILRLYTEAQFTALANQVRGSLAPDQDQADLDVTLFSAAERLEQDSNGRVRIPRHQLLMAGFVKEEEPASSEGDSDASKAAPIAVMVAGARDRLEVWGREHWKQTQAQRFNSLPTLVARLGARQTGGGATG